MVDKIILSIHDIDGDFFVNNNIFIFLYTYIYSIFCYKYSFLIKYFNEQTIYKPA